MEMQNKKIVDCLKERDIAGAEKALQEAKLQADKSLTKIQEMEAYEGNDDLRQSCIEFIDLYKMFFNNEYEQAFAILRNTENRSAADVEKLAQILSSVDTENAFVKADLWKSIRRFCKDYELTIDNY